MNLKEIFFSIITCIKSFFLLIGYCVIILVVIFLLLLFCAIGIKFLVYFFEVIMNIKIIY